MRLLAPALPRWALPRWAWPFVAAVVAGLVGAGVGLRPVDALLVGLVTLVLATVWLALPGGQEDPWRPGRPDDAAGTRSELSVLTWAFVGRDGRVSEAAVRHLRGLAGRRLARLDLADVDDLTPLPAGALPDEARDRARARARAALGDRAWAALTASGGWMPSLADVAHCVDVIERLGAPAPAEPPARPTEGPTS
ncbi:MULTISPECIES: hypothetical protein [unclassified Actinotalea]|uniref:hypothetical protein n=1 Tax=unclassified Actinotalea TaxID=2638618 RepID=UPI0015F364B3|nr:MULTISPECIES: hypothetical protein [unclassified Actinotalea]